MRATHEVMSRSCLVTLLVSTALLTALAGCRSTAPLSGPPAARAVSVTSLPPPLPTSASASPGEPALQLVSLVQEVEEEIPLPPDPGQVDGVLTLSAAIRRAFEANPDLVSAAEQIAAADASLGRARADFYPRLGVSEQYGVSNNPVTAFTFQLSQAQLNLMQNFNRPPTTDDFHTQFRLQQNVFSGQRRWHAVHAAEAQSAAATLNLAALQNTLVFQVAEAYYRLLQARNLVAVRREAVAQVQQHLEIVETRFRNDTAVKSDVLTVEVRLAEEREGLITAQNQLELAWAVLENVIGASLGDPGVPESIPLAPWSERVENLEAALAAAAGERAEIGALASQREAAAEDVLVAEAAKRPTVDAVADYDIFTGDFQRGNDSFFVGVICQLNLFDGGRTRTDVARAAAKLRELQARERRLMLDIELDVRRAYLQLEDARERLKVAEQAIEQARESLREVEVRYRGQSATITQLIDGQVALSNARVRRTNARADLEIAAAALERAVGRLTNVVHP